jgi:hypothetical protein
MHEGVTRMASRTVRLTEYGKELVNMGAYARIHGTLNSNDINWDALGDGAGGSFVIHPREVSITMTTQPESLTVRLRGKLGELTDAYLQAKHVENQIHIENGLVGSARLSAGLEHANHYATCVQDAERVSTQAYTDILAFAGALPKIGLTRAEIVDIFEGVIDTEFVRSFVSGHDESDRS